MARKRRERRIPRYETYTIQFDEEHAADGLDVLCETSDEFSVVDDDTYAINGEQLNELKRCKIPFRVLGRD